MGVCNQITLLTFYCNSSRLVTHLKVIDAPVQDSDIFDLNFSFKVIILAFRYY